MKIHVVREQTPQTNGDPDHVIEEATEMLVIESEPSWRVNIEHVGCETLIRIECSSHEEAVDIIDRIEDAIARDEPRIRVEPGHLVSLVAFRQAWVEQSSGHTVTTAVE